MYRLTTHFTFCILLYSCYVTVGISQTDSKSSGFFRPTTFCRKARDGTFETIERRFSIFAILFGWKEAACKDVCAELCDHNVCMSDYEISTDEDKCTCIQEAKEMACGANAYCRDDQCSCDEGFTGDPESQCISMTTSPIGTLPHTFPESTITSTDALQNLTAYLNVDLLGLQIDIRVRIYESGSAIMMGEFLKQGDQSNTYTLIGTRTTYDIVFDWNSVEVGNISGVDCSSGSCSAGALVANLSVDLRGDMSFDDVAIAFRNHNGTQYQIVNNVGNTLVTTPVFALPNMQIALYNEYYNSSSLNSTPLVIDSIDCSTGSCSLLQNVTTDLNVDLTGFKNYDGIYVTIYEPSTEAILRDNFTLGNESITFTLINAPTVYDVVLSKWFYDSTDDSWDKAVFWNISGLNCSSGSCSAGLLVANLTMDLTGNMDMYDAFIKVGNEYGLWYHKVTNVGNSVSAIPVIAMPGTRVALYNQYYAWLSLPSTPLVIDNIDCSLGSCSLPTNLTTDLNIDSTGLSFHSGINVVIYESITKALLRDEFNSGNQNFTCTLINTPTEYDVVFGQWFYSSTDGVSKINAIWNISGIDCSSGFCSAGSLVANLTVDLTGNSSSWRVSVAFRTQDGIEFQRNLVENAVSTIPVFAMPGIQLLLYDQQMYSDPTPLVIDNIDCSSGSCPTLNNLTSEIVVDLTALSTDSNTVEIYDSATGTIIRQLSNQSNQTHSYSVLCDLSYYVLVLDDTSTNLYSNNTASSCPCGGSCILP